MPLENELYTIYDGTKEALKVNLEDLKRYKEGQRVKQEKRYKRKTHARAVAKEKGYRIGRWTGTYAKVKVGSEAGMLFNMNSLSLHDTRPGKGSVDHAKTGTE